MKSSERKYSAGRALEQPAWRRAHDELVRLAKTRARLERGEGRWLLVAAREGTHARLGYASFVEYVERLFGYSPRFTLEKVRVAEALEVLPETSRALDEGALNWSAARELTRVANRDTEGEWLALAAGRTAREVERLVSGHRAGSKPSDEPNSALRRHAIRLEVSGETLASFRDAKAKLRRDAGGSLDDDALVLLFARQILGGPTDEGRASYQVSLSVCEHCRRGFQRGMGESVQVEREVVEMAECDAQHIGHTSESVVDDGPSDSIVDNSPHVGGEVAAYQPGGKPVTPTPPNASRRATQSVAPSVRRRVLVRDSGRCSVPGCRHSVFVDVHHVDPRADGGDHRMDNLITLCGAHHRAVHRGNLTIARVAGAFRFRHGDGSDYGSLTVSPGSAEARATAFRALRSLGFRETESKRALERATSGVSSEATAEMLLRLALRELTRVAA